jgi:hypothetical protein
VTLVTALIASISLLVATSGLVLAIVNTVRTHRLQFPRPRWRHSWDDRMHEPWMLALVTQSVRFTLENRGRGAALDVDFTMGGQRVNDPENRLDMRFSDSYSFWLALDGQPPLLHADAGNGAIDEVSPGGIRSTPPHKVTVTWSQEPNVHKRRTRTFTFNGSMTKYRPPWTTDPGRT